MALSLQPRQTQKQAMTPAMWLGLNLLTLPIGELRDAVKRELDSNPALEVEVPSSYAVAVTPDVRVNEDGEVEVDQRDVPELRVSPKYVELAKDKAQDEETRAFAAERVKRAREFREAVVKRRETMEKIAELAIGGQAEFLRKGAVGLRRQTMSEVAKRAKCNVATVSRAAARKYVKTPRGTVPLRKFFALVDQLTTGFLV